MIPQILLQKAQAWMAFISTAKRKGELQTVDGGEVERRAAICKKCPRRKDYVSACEGCKTNMAIVRRAILNGGRAPNEGLQGCEALGEDIGLAVHIKQVPVNDAPRQPGNCWRRV